MLINSFVDFNEKILHTYTLKNKTMGKIKSSINILKYSTVKKTWLSTTL